MKVRNGFVSNSSSSSFCILGIDNSKLIKELFERDVFDEGQYQEYHDEIYFGYGTCIGKYLEYYGEGLSYPIAAGLDATETLSDMSINQAKEYFTAYVKENMGIDIDPKYVNLHYGEAGNE